MGLIHCHLYLSRMTLVSFQCFVSVKIAIFATNLSVCNYSGANCYGRFVSNFLRTLTVILQHSDPHMAVQILKNMLLDLDFCGSSALCTLPYRL